MLVFFFMPDDKKKKKTSCIIILPHHHLMSPPLWRLEREDPPPRRKSCLACAKAKRRCDQRLPACVRCAQRKIPCEYHPSSRSSASASASASTTRAARSLLRSPAFASSLATPERRVQAEVAGDRESHREHHDHGQAGDGNGRLVAESNGVADCFEGPWGGDAEEALLYPWLQDGPLRSVDVDGLVPSVQPSGWTTALEDLDLFGEKTSASGFSAGLAMAHEPSIPARPRPLQLSSPIGFNVEDISRVLENTMSYALDKIKSAPKQMLLELQTPWCHASLYKDAMPPVMQGE